MSIIPELQQFAHPRGELCRRTGDAHTRMLVRGKLHQGADADDDRFARNVGKDRRAGISEIEQALEGEDAVARAGLDCAIAAHGRQKGTILSVSSLYRPVQFGEGAKRRIV